MNFLPLFFTLLLLSSFAIAKETPCDPNNRSDLDKDVEYDKPGDCQPNERIQTCKEDICSSNVDPKLSTYFNPVCGVKAGKGQKILEETYENVCLLCEEGKFAQYYAGPCMKERSYCSRSFDSNLAFLLGDSVCAHFTIDDVGSVYTTAPTSFEACQDNLVDYWMEGACQPLRDNATYCFPNNRPKDCLKEYNPVCGFYMEAGDLDYRILENGCLACASADILFYTPGTGCKIYCDWDSEKAYDCIGNLEPVCGTYVENGQEKNVSLRNSCLGCYIVDKPIISFTHGLCPGDKGIRCENDEAAFIEGILNPVCGYSREDCHDTSCQETYAEPFLACDSGRTLWYSIGACPGDRGVSCDDYRRRPKDPDFVYEDVCGITREGQRDDYADQYEACANCDVIYFTKGPCSLGFIVSL